MTTMTKTIARTFALAAALAMGGAAATAHTAEACGGYVQVTEQDRVQWALSAFLGELGKRVSYGAAVITGATKAQVTIEMDTAAGGKRRAKARQTFFLEKRDGAWAVVDWSMAVAAPAAAKVAKR
ncbi:MAG TPA: hypothetical protein VM261_24925 [Kofleriaceae bacterium]|nr:hypothetical protein [Kofleriaceae bacterium]